MHINNNTAEILDHYIMDTTWKFCDTGYWLKLGVAQLASVTILRSDTHRRDSRITIIVHWIHAHPHTQIHTQTVLVMCERACSCHVALLLLCD